MLLSSWIALATIFVSPTGSDDAPGTLVRPLKSLEKAVALSRSTRIRDIQLTAGRFELSETLTLGRSDSGLRIHGSETGASVITGATLLTARPVNAPERTKFPSTKKPIEIAPLTEFGWEMQPRGWDYEPGNVSPEILFDGMAGHIARWPNGGYATAQLRDKNRLSYEASVPKVSADRLWAVGFWGQEWADHMTRVLDVTPGHEFEIESTGHYGTKPTARFTLVNAPELLDAPGEYWVDNENDQVFFIRPAGAAQIELTRVEDSLINVSDSDSVRLDHLTIQGSRQHGISGTHAQKLRVDHCIVQGVAGNGIDLSNALNSSISQCHVRSVGCTGIAVKGGNRKLLTPSNNVISDCEVEQTNRLWRTSHCGGISLEGVGVSVLHNAIHHIPNMGVYMRNANDILIQGNEFYKVGLDVDDSGVVYAGRDWSLRGLKVLDNYFHDIGRVGREGINAVYLDDLLCGAVVNGNVFVKADRALLLGGGSDNSFQGNLIIDSPQGISVDDRGLNWAKTSIEQPGNIKDNYRKSLAHTKLWKDHYPELAGFDISKGGIPMRNVVSSNLFVNSPIGMIAPVASQHGRIQNNSIRRNSTSNLADLEKATRAQRGGIAISVGQFGPRVSR